MSRAVRLFLVLTLCLSGAALPLVPASGQGANSYDWTEVYFESFDGTMLHADVLRPAGYPDKKKTPVILSIGPYFNTSGGPPLPNLQAEGPNPRFADLWEEGRIFERGYTYVQVDSRGYGASQGCNDLGGPNEQGDAKAAVEWAAKQPWSNGKVGMWGKSYDAWTQVMALAEKPKGLAATVIQAPLIEAYRGFFMNGVHYAEGWYATPGLYALYDLTPPSVNSDPQEFINYLTAAAGPHCFGTNLSMTTVPDHSIPYWQERDIRAAAGKSKVPTLWTHGFHDDATKANNLMDVWSKLRGPKRAWFGQWGHDRGNEAQKVGRDGFMDEAMRWFDYYLKGLPLSKAPIHKDPAIEVQTQDGEWRTEAQWPPADSKFYNLPILDGEYQDSDDNQSEGGTQHGLWTFTQPFPHEAHISGETKVSAIVQTEVPYANLIALVYDIAPSGQAYLVSRGAYLLQGSGEVKFDIYPQDWRVKKGHRLGILLSGSDRPWFATNNTDTTVIVESGRFSVPFLRYQRERNLKGKRSHIFPAPIMVDKSLFKDRTAKAELPPRLKRR